MLSKPRSLIVTLTLLAVTAASLATLLLPATELTRFRNSLLARSGQLADFEWQPSAAPAGYRRETIVPPAEFIAAAATIRDAADGEIPLMRGLVEHLRVRPKRQGPIKSTTLHAYREIREKGRGYCADYTQVFNGLAYSAGLPVREWGLSFDRFSGDGHAFNEIYDHALAQWVFVDPMHGFYVRDGATGRALSALEFRERLTRSDGFESVSIEPIGNTFLFASPREAFDYYVPGADQFFLWFGNDVFSYDAHPAVAAFSWSRSLESLAALVLRIHPTIRVYPTATNAGEIAALLRLPYYVLGITAIAALLGLLALVQGALILRERRMARSADQGKPG